MMNQFYPLYLGLTPYTSVLPLIPRSYPLYLGLTPYTSVDRLGTPLYHSFTCEEPQQGHHLAIITPHDLTSLLIANTLATIV